MATVTYQSALAAGASLIDQIDFANLLVTGVGSGATLTDPTGVRIEIQGDSFWYAPGSPTWTINSGHMTTLQVYDAANTLLFQVSGADTDARKLYDWIVAGNDFLNDVDGSPTWSWGDDVTLNGTDFSEHLITGDGNDVLYGGRGRDVMESTGGNDTMTGGMGKDQFIAPELDQLLIRDFWDQGRQVNQDVIVASRYGYHHMTVQQIGADCLIILGDRNPGTADPIVMLENYDSTRLDRTDFMLV